MGKPKKPKVGQAVAFKGAVATIAWVGDPLRKHTGATVWPLRLNTHAGTRNAWTDHPELHIP